MKNKTSLIVKTKKKDGGLASYGYKDIFRFTILKQILYCHKKRQISKNQ